MARTTTHDGVFKPPSSRSETKADSTDSAARAIMKSEAAQREAKTARLRAARLAQEAVDGPPAPVTKPARAKAAKKR